MQILQVALSFAMKLLFENACPKHERCPFLFVDFLNDASVGCVCVFRVLGEIPNKTGQNFHSTQVIFFTILPM